MAKEIDMTGCMTLEEFRASMHAYIHEQGEVLARRLRKDREEMNAQKHNSLITK
jgi:hypothetical protein